MYIYYHYYVLQIQYDALFPFVGLDRACRCIGSVMCGHQPRVSSSC